MGLAMNARHATGWAFLTCLSLAAMTSCAPPSPPGTGQTERDITLLTSSADPTNAVQASGHYEAARRLASMGNAIVPRIAAEIDERKGDSTARWWLMTSLSFNESLEAEVALERLVNEEDIGTEAAAALAFRGNAAGKQQLEAAARSAKDIEEREYAREALGDLDLRSKNDDLSR